VHPGREDCVVSSQIWAMAEEEGFGFDFPFLRAAIVGTRWFATLETLQTKDLVLLT